MCFVVISFWMHFWLFVPLMSIGVLSDRWTMIFVELVGPRVL